jgi:hypothetical protein
MRTLPVLLLTAAIGGLPLVAYAHTGGALDAEGCHADHRKGTYHCHRGDAAGYTFPNRAAMQEAVRTGKFPDKSVDEEGFFDKLWPWGNKHEQQETTPEKDADDSAGKAASPGAAAQPPTAPASGSPPPADGAAPPADSPVVVTPPAGSAPTAPAAPSAPQSEPERRLKVLQGLYEMGLISREEYEAKRKEVLGQL